MYLNTIFFVTYIILMLGKFEIRDYNLSKFERLYRVNQRNYKNQRIRQIIKKSIKYNIRNIHIPSNLPRAPIQSIFSNFLFLFFSHRYSVMQFFNQMLIRQKHTRLIINNINSPREDRASLLLAINRSSASRVQNHKI